MAGEPDQDQEEPRTGLERRQIVEGVRKGAGHQMQAQEGSRGARVQVATEEVESF